MQNRLYRITPLGYVIICIIIFSITWISSTLIRGNQVRYQLAYAINKINEKGDKSLDVDFSFNTIGDAVLYEQKKLESNNLIQLRSDFVAIDGDFSFQDMSLNDYQLYLTQKGIISTNHNKHAFVEWNKLTTIWHDQAFDLEHLYEIMKPSEKEKITFRQRDLNKILSVFDDHITKDQNTFSIELDVVTWIHLIDQMILELSEHPDFENSVKKRYSAFYDAFAHHQMLKDNDLNSRVLFSKIVELNDDLYGTCHLLLDTLQDRFNHLFTEGSTFRVTFLVNDNKITHFTLQGDLYYKAFDARESLYVSIVDQPLVNKTLPEEPIHDLKPIIKDFFQSIK